MQILSYDTASVSAMKCRLKKENKQGWNKRFSLIFSFKTYGGGKKRESLEKPNFLLEILNFIFFPSSTFFLILYVFDVCSIFFSFAVSPLIFDVLKQLSFVIRLVISNDFLLPLITRFLLFYLCSCFLRSSGMKITFYLYFWWGIVYALRYRY